MTDATAEALAGGEAMPTPPPMTEATEALEMTSEMDEDAALDAAFDRAQEADDEGAPEEAQEAATEAEPEEPEQEAAESDSEAPTDLPGAVRDAWKDIPDTARDAIVNAQREMARKTGDMGRQISALGPIRDALVQASQDLPALSKMTPDQVTSELTQLARWAQTIDENPVAALEHIARSKGVDLAQHYGGQPATQEGGDIGQLRQHIAGLENQLQQALSAADPTRIAQEVNASLEHERHAQAVTEFASSKDDWDAVESKIPAAVSFVMETNPSMSPMDVLAQAYTLAGGQHTASPKAEGTPAPSQAPASPDPDKAKAAKSVNVAPKPSRERNLSEDEILDRAYDRAQKR